MRTGCFLLLLTFFLLPVLRGQRSYKNASVLASGNWYKIAVSEPGVYKINIPLLNKLGINTSNLSSAAIRLFGNGGAMLPEACNGFKNDDLVENAIQVIDGGDGLFNGNDYFLFFTTGPDTWIKDSVNQRFKHQKHLYSNQSYYFITIGGTGKRVPAQNSSLLPNTTVTSFSERWFHELDTVNLLNSGKDWYGEELSASDGHTTSQAFSVPLQGINTAQPATIVSACVARSVNGSSLFTTNINGQPVLQHDIAAVGNTNLDLFAKSSQSAASFTPGANLFVSYNFTPGGANARGWIDWFEIFCRRNLSLTKNEQLLFRDWNSVAPAAISRFIIQNAAAAQVWDVTNATDPLNMTSTANGSDLSFINNTSSLREYIAFSTDFLVPEAINKTANQDLHNSQPADLIIVTYPPLLQQAQRIAAFHQQKDNLKTVTVTTDQVFNEFSSGIADPTAIRDFVKMYYDKAGADSSQRPKYLLLLGDASYDYKNRTKNNSNYVPGYQNNASLDPLSTYTSDDFFGFLDDKEDINDVLIPNLLDIGIGRIPAQTPAQASAYVDKLINYTDPKSLGPWRNEQTFIADDQDANLHFNDAEVITNASTIANPLFIQNKIYLDAYTQASTPAGSRYPEVNQAINNQVQNGTLIWNYNGHGSSTRLAEEVVLEKNIVDTWHNTYRLPLFITATCDFAPYDNPAVNSLGEDILLREKTGAIALMTTTRLVFAFSNRIMNKNYLQAALQPRNDGSYMSLGEAVKQAKNLTYQTQADITNNRKFTLLGDPALTLAYPKYRVQTLTVNGKAVNAQPDTLKALNKYNIGGNVTDVQGNQLNSFNGVLYATIFDKAETISTRGNDADSYQQNFQVQRSPIFKGKVNVVNGQFDFSFIVPKDINYQPGNGRINYYADNGQLDGNGNFNGFLIGGSQVVSSDNAGPVIKAYLDDEKFINGNTVNPAPVLLLNLADSSGINIAGTGIGHDITAIVDGDTKQMYVLNSFFETELDSYQKGSIRFQLPAMTEGTHTMVIKAWDVANNSSEVTIRFRVVKQGLRIDNVMNYPNPFTARTSFRFEHNRPGINLKLNMKIFTAFGKLVKTIETTINTTGNRSSDIDWPGTDDSGRILAPGIYIYQLQVTSAADGETAVKSGKLLRL
ncbi:MAG: type IX secretion system sortase PorU [Chitinophagaceae bacterium]